MMRNIFEVNPENYSNRRKLKIAWEKVLSVLCAVMVFVTTYAMVLPALTYDGESPKTTTSGSSSEENDGVYFQKKISTDEDGNLKLTIESYVTGETKVVEYNEPADIVLLLDASQSMTNSVNTYKVAYSVGTSGTYYYLNNTSYSQVYYCSTCKGWYTSRHSGNKQHNVSGTKLTPKTSATDTDTNHTQFYSATSTTKLAILKDAAKKFVTKLGELSSQTRVSVIKFSANNDTGTKILKGLTELTSSNITSINNEIQNITDEYYTSADRGMKLANNVLTEARKAQGYNRKQFVIMFTDGEPCHSSSKLETAVANDTIAKAKEIKAYDNAKIYTIGCFGDTAEHKPDIYAESAYSSLTDVDKYMHYTSSNFKNAQSLSIPGKLSVASTASSYYKLAKEADDILTIFETVSEEIHSATVSLGAETQIRDYISKYYLIDEKTGILNGGIKVYTSDFAGLKDGKKQWKDPVEFNAIISYSTTPPTSDGVHKDFYIQVAAQSGSTGFVSVQNFDFSANYVDVNQTEESEHIGKKLIIDIPIKENPEEEPESGFAETNAPGSGIYRLTEDGYKSFVDLPFPEAENPAKVNVNLKAINAATIPSGGISFVTDGLGYRKFLEPDQDQVDRINLDPKMDEASETFNISSDTKTEILYAIDHTVKGDTILQTTINADISNATSAQPGTILRAKIDGVEKALSYDSNTKLYSLTFVPTGTMNVELLLDYSPTRTLTIVNKTDKASDDKVFKYKVEYPDIYNENYTKENPIIKTVEFELAPNTRTGSENGQTYVQGLTEIPNGVDVKITEINPDGYIVLYEYEDETIASGPVCPDSEEGKLTMDKDKTIIVHNNLGGALPATGSAAGLIITLIGALLVLVSVAGTVTVLVKRRNNQ